MLARAAMSFIDALSDCTTTALPEVFPMSGGDLCWTFREAFHLYLLA